MRCERFEELLFDYLDRRLESGQAAAVIGHAAGCERCGDLLQLAEGDAGGLLEAPESMLGEIMVRTGGEACGRARRRLAEIDDGDVADLDPMLQLHVEDCTECAAVQRALVALRRDLPELAELEPDPDFLNAVMAATAAAPRLADWWHRLISRPRVALEGAYVGAVIVTLIFGVPASAFTSVPTRVYQELRDDRAGVRRVVVDGWDTVTTAGIGGWEAVTREVDTRLEGWMDAATGASGVEASMGTWRAGAGRLIGQIQEHLIEPLIERVRAIWRAMWRTGGHEPDERMETTNRGDHDERDADERSNGRRA
jgi:hypothetical protein